MIVNSQQVHFYINSLFRIRSAGMLYELTQYARAAWFSVNKQRRTEIIFYEICQLLLVLVTKFWSLMCFFLKKMQGISAIYVFIWLL